MASISSAPIASTRGRTLPTGIVILSASCIRASSASWAHGAADNVGSYVVQFARSRNLHVIGTIFGGDHGYVRGLGADQVMIRNLKL
jgi:NADPH-dependent curcumin reductase CurA